MRMPQLVLCVILASCGCKTGVEGFTFRGELPAGLSAGTRTALNEGSCGSEDNPAPITNGCAGGSIANLQSSADLCDNTYPIFSNMGSYLDQLKRYPYESYCPPAPPPPPPTPPPPEPLMLMPKIDTSMEISGEGDNKEGNDESDGEQTFTNMFGTPCISCMTMDTCRYALDGECDEPRYCALGTDCTD
eukprot:SAG11_NODE_3142_length_2656_cov_3.797028_3_plen_188_part_01